MTGRDYVDDAAAVIASLRAEVAAQRDLLERVMRLEAEWRTARYGDYAAKLAARAEADIGRDLIAVHAAIRAHLAGAAETSGRDGGGNG